MLGYSPNRLGIGASVDRYELTVDLLFLWLILEFKSPIPLTIKKKGNKNAKGI